MTGWASPVVAFTPETAGLLARAGLSWTTDVTLCRSAHQAPHAARRDRRRAHHRFLRQSRDARPAARPLRRLQGHLRLPLRERTDGAHRDRRALPVRRPAADHRGAAGGLEVHRGLSRRLFARHQELAQWALASDVDEHTYQSRFSAATPRARRRGKHAPPGLDAVTGVSGDGRYPADLSAAARVLPFGSSGRATGA